MPLPVPYPYHDTMTRLQEIASRVESIKLIAMLIQGKVTYALSEVGELTKLTDQWDAECHELVRCVMSMTYPNPTTLEKDNEK